MKRRLLLTAVVAATAMLTASPNALAADDTNTGKPGRYPGGLPCTDNNSGAKACFQERGDKIWVKDYAGDGHSAIGVWHLYLGDGQYRKGWCRNKSRSGTWRVCDKEMGEDQSIEFWAVDYDAETKSWTDWSLGRLEIN
jgi:hypothetical protein